MIAEENLEFVIHRVLDAPRETVWQAWSEAEHLAHWWGPKGCVLEVVALDFRVGGTFHYGMKMPAGGEMWGKFIYREIDAPQRLVYVSSFADADENVTRAPFDDRFPMHILNSVTFEEHGDKTTLTLRAAPLDATETERAFFAEMHDSMRGGFGSTLDQLAEYLAHRVLDVDAAKGKS